MTDFNQKNILVAGGSSGIGLALCNRLAAKGARVISLSRHAAESWATGVTHLPFDVLKDDFTALPAQLPEQLHGVVYAIGSINLKPFNRLSTQDFLNDFQVNTLGAAQLLQQCLKPLKAAGSASVVLFSTVAASTGMGFHASIAMAKGGINGLTLALAAELAPQHIRVNALTPSLTDTPLAGNLLSTEDKREASNKRHPLGRYGKPDDLAAAAELLLSDDGSWITGQIWGIDGGLSAIRPL
ncbi:SDR family oxidoreductase [Mucilaginibacter koreensis]